MTRPRSPASTGKTCTLTPLGSGQDDVPQILTAFEDCNNGGTVVFPENATFYIATRLNPVLSDVTIDWKGEWLFSDDLDYWRNNSYPIAFQNHHAGFVISGERIHLNGYGTGKINGSGNTWYTAEAGDTQPGRPMPFVWWNVSDVLVEHFTVTQSPLWSINIMNGTEMWFDDIYVNNTALDAPYGTNWVQNTDGFDTMDAYNIRLTNFVYQGGDDAIAIKPRSYNVYIQNITVHGGNGVAIGSLGQYLEDSSVENVIVKDAQILTYNDDLETGAYIKTWVGELVPQSSYESDYLPRGGGWGVVTNILFENFYLQGPSVGMDITQDSGDNGSYPGTSNMLVSNVAFVNFTGYVNSATRTAAVSCSARNPCYNIAMRNISLDLLQNGTVAEGAVGTCSYTAEDGVYGMTGTGC
ncbi:family 28 glycoside hydrolase [Cryphonectria parasitica EP155]|uniref:galacturonan 1,4-alpha-galacturonidase n=1 Tax=Cryphonectria parasitica (strain ATCC 38755 / EP155) TaxID=660469 RepID=A0A9P4Y6F3_CRYP1|nr:family 28 glycoside hydrolase [Cryphonectria parasitica EP155]KAF3767566.1 family 28 glycoside hydrolase [Cryphonectria parasitica EP155]